MISIGKACRLLVVKEVDFGVYLDGEEYDQILLPKRYVPDGCTVDDWVDVFLYLDSEDIIVATTEIPYVEVGQYAHLRVVDTNSYGAFIDWGLPKNLLVPFREQRVPMKVGQSYTVWVFEDKSGRLCTSSKLDRYLDEKSNGKFKKNQSVDLHIVSKSPLGYRAIIDDTHLGLIFYSDVLAPIAPGERIQGYIKNIRPDGAIDLMMQPEHAGLSGDLSDRILEALRQSGGVLSLADKSTAEDIFNAFQVSKGNYKKAIGQLYKRQKIMLEKDRITLLAE